MGHLFSMPKNKNHFIAQITVKFSLNVLRTIIYTSFQNIGNDSGRQRILGINQRMKLDYPHLIKVFFECDTQNSLVGSHVNHI